MALVVKRSVWWWWWWCGWWWERFWGEHRRKIRQYLGSLCASVNFSNDTEWCRGCDQPANRRRAKHFDCHHQHCSHQPHSKEGPGQIKLLMHQNSCKCLFILLLLLVYLHFLLTYWSFWVFLITWTISVYPCQAATWRAVLPSASFNSVLAPDYIVCQDNCSSCFCTLH